jgi:hypothetical protein
MSTEKYLADVEEHLGENLGGDEHEDIALRALFERRAAVMPLPRSLESRVMDAVDSVAHERADRRAGRATATRIAFALAACVSFCVGNGWLGWPGWLEGVGSPSRSMTMTVGRDDAVAMSTSMDEPLACALPVSGFVRTGPARAQACSWPEQKVSSHHDVARDPRVCEEALVSVATR